MSQKIIAVSSNDLRVVTDSITRPANVTAYTAGDVIAEVTTNDYFTFTDVLTGGAKTGEIVHAWCISSANQATKPDLELWLFHTAITEVADNAAFAPSDAEVATNVGVVALPLAGFYVGLSGAGAAGNIIQHVSPATHFRGVNAESGVDLYGQLVVRNAYTPISGEVFTVGLVVRAD